VVVAQTTHRDVFAVALQFAAHVETGPRKQGCPPVPAVLAIPASRALTTLRRSGKMLGSRGREGVKKQAFNASSVKGGRNFGLFAFSLSLGGCHNDRNGVGLVAFILC
jgi:hypothetical protein